MTILLSSSSASWRRDQVLSNFTRLLQTSKIILVQSGFPFPREWRWRRVGVLIGSLLEIFYETFLIRRLARSSAAFSVASPWSLLQFTPVPLQGLHSPPLEFFPEPAHATPFHHTSAHSSGKSMRWHGLTCFSTLGSVGMMHPWVLTMNSESFTGSPASG
jgi:hypothetical protein